MSMFLFGLGLCVTVVVKTLGSIFSEYSWKLSTWNPSMIITCSECLKCIVSVMLYYRQPHSISVKNIKLWAIPGLLYTALNTFSAFAFKYLPSHFIITVAHLKTVFSMLISTFFLGQTFTKQQWLAGIVICFGLSIIYITPFDGDSSTMWFSILFGICAALLSAGGGACCEYLYSLDPDESIHAQNAKLYSFGIIFNLVYFLARYQDTPQFHWTQIILIFQYAFAGILVSLILKFLGNVIRNIVGALTVVSVALASHLVLGNELKPNFIGGASFVIGGTLMYYFGKNTVKGEQ